MDEGGSSIETLLSRTAALLAQHEDPLELSAHAIPTLVGLLACGFEGAAANAANALAEAVSCAAFATTAREAGAVPRLVNLLCEGPTSRAAVAAAGACASLSVEPSCQAEIVELGGIKPLVVMLHHQESPDRIGLPAAERAAAALRNLAFRRQDHAARIVLHGGLFALVRMLDTDLALEQPRTVELACGALANITHAHPTNQLEACDARAIRPLVALLAAPTAAPPAMPPAASRSTMMPPAEPSTLSAAAEAVLCNLAAVNTHDVLAELVGSAPPPPLARIRHLSSLLRPVVAEKLRNAAADGDDFAMRYSMAAAEVLGLTDGDNQNEPSEGRLGQSFHHRRWQVGSWQPQMEQDAALSCANAEAECQAELRGRRMLQRDVEELPRRCGAGPISNPPSREGYGANGYGSTWL